MGERQRLVVIDNGMAGARVVEEVLERAPERFATIALHGGVKAISVDLGPVDTIPIGEGRAYCFGGRTIAVFRPRDGGLYALDDRCPHRAGPLADGIVGGGVVICPLHGWKFQLASGRCLNDGASVRTYPVVLVGGRIRLIVEEQP